MSSLIYIYFVQVIMSVAMLPLHLESTLAKEGHTR